MRLLKSLLSLAVFAHASPVLVSTVITDAQYQTTVLGAASPAVYVAAFLGTPQGIPFTDFQIVPDTPNWIVSALIDQLYQVQPAPADPPQFPALTPPLVPAPNPPCLTIDPPPAEIPEPSMKGLLVAVLVIGLVIYLVRRQ